MTPIVVIYGPKGSGKDTFGRRLAQALAMCLPLPRRRVDVLGFADPARAFVEDALGIPRDVVRGDSATKESYSAYGSTTRDHLRDVTRFLRDKHPDSLAHAALRRILSSPEAGGFVFTDARKGNEFSVLHDVLVRGLPAPWSHGPLAGATVPQGAYRMTLIGVRRPGSEDPADRHETETSFGEFVGMGGIPVVNDGPLERLFARADALGAALSA